MNKTATFALALIGAAAFAGAGYYMGQQHPPLAEAAVPAAAPAPVLKPVPEGVPEGEAATRRHIASGIKAGDTDPDNGHKILYYHDPMTPGTQFDKPGKSPFMDMMLVPVYADAGMGADDDQGVRISPRVQQNLGLRTAEVVSMPLASPVAAVGSIALNERELSVVQARAAGFVEKLWVRASLDRVAKGQVLAELLLPDWVAAQQEFLSLHRMNSGDASLLEAARARMRLLGMSDALISAVERSGQPDARLPITAPGSGLVTEIGVREGMTVAPGATLFRINGFGTVWANAELPEAQGALVRPGMAVRASAAALPGQRFEGRVQTLLPEVDAATRTLKARVELANPHGALMPGMFVTMDFAPPAPRPVLVVPSEAVIQTGKRAVVMLSTSGGSFRPVTVQTGQEVAGQTEIRSGLQAGQKVVVSSQFLIDSEASLKGVETRLNDAAEAPMPAMSGMKP